MARLTISLLVLADRTGNGWAMGWGRGDNRRKCLEAVVYIKAVILPFP